MTDEDKTPASPEDAELNREIRFGRKFSLAEAIGRLGGKKLLKGASPVTLKRQAALEIEAYLERHLVDAEGALEIVLLRRVRDSEILLKMGYQQPLAVLAVYIERILHSEERLKDLVNDVDAEWGRIYYERPHFQTDGSEPNREDPYTFSSVRATLTQLIEKLRSE